MRDKAALQLRQGLQALFDNADDTLFEMADKAASSSEQNFLFEAMRDLRLKRKNIERGFLDRFYEAFVRIGRAEPMLLPTSCLGSVRVMPKKAVHVRSWRVSGCSRSSTVAY